MKVKRVDLKDDGTLIPGFLIKRILRKPVFYPLIIIINHPQFGNFVWSGVLLFGTDSGGDGQPLTLPQGAA